MAFSNLDAHTAHYVYVVVFCSVCALQNDTHEKICLVRCHVAFKVSPKTTACSSCSRHKNLASNYKAIVVVQQLYLLSCNSIYADHNE